jgi:hypothetical protein
MIGTWRGPQNIGLNAAPLYWQRQPFGATRRAWALAFDNERRFQQWQAAYGEAAAEGPPQGGHADALREEAQQLLQGLLDVLSGGALESTLLQQQARIRMPMPH